MLQDGVASLTQRSLRAEVCDDVDEAVAQVWYLQARRDPLHKPQGVYIASYVIQQCPYKHRPYQLACPLHM